MQTTLLTRLTQVAAAATLMVAASAHAQFITGANSTFAGTTPGVQSNDTTVNGTNWVTTNPTGTDYMIGGTGDGLVYTPNASTGTSGDNYLALADGRSAGLLLQANSFTGVGGAAAYQYNLSFIVQGFSSDYSGGGQGNSGSTVNYSWVVGRAASMADALSNTFTSTFGTGGGSTDNNINTWESVATTFTTTAGGPYTNVYFVFRSNSNNATDEFVGIDNVSAVPEPETYAMMLAGLGALGFMSRRRRQG